MRVQLLVIFFVLSSYVCVSQEIEVKNMRTGEPLESVAVFNQEMDKSSITNEKGIAVLKNFDDLDTLFFQHPSFERYIIPFSQVNPNTIILLERKNILIPEFVVTASKHRENKREVPYLVDIISSKSIELSSAQNSADILTNSGNVFVQKSQAGGGSPVLRGFEANRVLLVIDGVRMNNAIYRSGHLQNSLTIDNAILERVEVIYGPTSVMYGSDALGGVIHYMSKMPELAYSEKKFIPGGSAYIQGATGTSSLKGHLDLNLGFKKLAFLSSITYGKYGDIRMGFRRNPFLEDWGKQMEYVERIDGVDSVVTNSNPNIIRYSGYDQIDFMQKILYKPTQYVDLQFNYQYSNSSNINRQDQLNNRLDNDSLEYAEWYYGPQKRQLAMIKTQFSKSNNFYNSFEATLAYQDIEESRTTRAYGADTLFNQQEGVQIGTGNFDFYKEISARNSVSYGLEFNYNKVSSIANKNNIIDNTSLPDISRYPDEGTETMASGAYVSYKSRLHPKLLSSIGLRLQYYSLRAAYGEFYQELPDVFRNVSLENQAITSSLSFIVNQSRSFNWNIIFSTGFRSPNLDDLAKIRLTSGKLTLPNSNLKAEYSYNAEIGASKTYDGYIQINANYFLTYLTNAITREAFSFPDGSDSIYFQGEFRSTYQNVNSSESIIHGFSINMISDLNSNVSFRSTLNYTYGQDLSMGGPKAHIPPIFGRTSFSYELNRFLFEVTFIYAGWKHIGDMVLTGEDKDDEATEYGFPGWYTINLNSAYKISDNLTFQLAIENITDNYYKPFASGVPAPGINFVGTLRYKF